MITRIVYNCDPESLYDISQEVFAEAFENEVRVKPLFRDCDIEVTFKNGSSGLHSVAGVDLPEDPVSVYADQIQHVANRAYIEAIELDINGSRYDRSEEEVAGLNSKGRP